MTIPLTSSSTTRVLARAAAVTAVAVSTTLSTSTPAHAAGASIGNGGSRSFSICHNAASESQCASGTGSLSPGQNSRSKYGWEDTDMIYIAMNCKLYRNTYIGAGQTGWALWASAGSSGRWFKVTNDAGGSYKVVC